MLVCARCANRLRAADQHRGRSTPPADWHSGGPPACASVGPIGSSAFMIAGAPGTAGSIALGRGTMEATAAARLAGDRDLVRARARSACFLSPGPVRGAEPLEDDCHGREVGTSAGGPTIRRQVRGLATISDESPECASFRRRCGRCSKLIVWAVTRTLSAFERGACGRVTAPWLERVARPQDRRACRGSPCMRRRHPVRSGRSMVVLGVFALGARSERLLRVRCRVALRRQPWARCRPTLRLPDPLATSTVEPREFLDVVTRTAWRVGAHRRSQPSLEQRLCRDGALAAKAVAIERVRREREFF